MIRHGWPGGAGDVRKMCDGRGPGLGDTDPHAVPLLHVTAQTAAADPNAVAAAAERIPGEFFAERPASLLLGFPIGRTGFCLTADGLNFRASQAARMRERDQRTAADLALILAAMRETRTGLAPTFGHCFPA